MFIIGTESCWASWEIWHLNVDDLLFGKVINTEWYSSVICHILGTFIIKRNFEIISCLSSLRKLKWWFVDIFSFLFILNSTGRLRVDNRQHMLYQVCYLNITLFFYLLVWMFFNFCYIWFILISLGFYVVFTVILGTLDFLFSSKTCILYWIIINGKCE